MTSACAHIYRRILFAITGILLFCQHCEATLVISIYNDHAVYLASDSLLTPCTNKLIKIHGPKIFLLSSNFCVAMTGLYGMPLAPQTGYSTPGLFTLSDELKGLCDEEYPLARPARDKITSICDDFKAIYLAQLAEMKAVGISLPPGDLGTRLYFAGYDASTTNFGGITYVFGTNLAGKVVFVRGVNKFESPINIFGEGKFLSAVTSSDDPKFKKIRSKIPKTYVQALRETPLPEKKVVDLILQLFELHQEYASSFYPDEGYIGEPYVIYKITEDGVKRVH